MSQLKYDAYGLIPAIVQDADSWSGADAGLHEPEALQTTLRTGETHFWSRSRQELWHKGATSGNVQRVVEIAYDCDADTLLVRVHPAGPACHTGNVTCFFQEIQPFEENT